MIKFLGHIINTEPDQDFESCLMVGPNKPNYETFLEQAAFLKNTYILMQIDHPREFYKIIKININDHETLSICKKCLEENRELKTGVKKHFLLELKSYANQGLDVSYYVDTCANNEFSIELITRFLHAKKLTDEMTREIIQLKEQTDTKNILSKKRKIYQNNRRG